MGLEGTVITTVWAAEAGALVGCPRAVKIVPTG